MHVAVTGMAKAARSQPAAGADRGHALDSIGIFDGRGRQPAPNDRSRMSRHFRTRRAGPSRTFRSPTIAARSRVSEPTRIVGGES